MQTSIPELKNVIKSVEDDFDVHVGVMQGTAAVNICTWDDLKELWLEAKKGVKVLLWCDVLYQMFSPSSF